MSKSLGKRIGLLLILAFVGAACSPAAPAPAATSAPAAAPAATSAPAAAAPAGKPIVFGMIADRSGTASFYSSLAADSITVAVKQINAEGGILGRPVELRSENDNNDPNLSLSLARKLIQGGADVLLLASGSGAVVADRAALQDAKVVGIASLGIDEAILKQPNADYIFQVNMPGSKMYETVGNGMQALGYKRIGLFYLIAPFVEAAIPTVETAFGKYGATIVAKEGVPADVIDVTSQMLRLRDAKLDAIMSIPGDGKVEIPFLKKRYEMGIKTPVFDAANIAGAKDLWDQASPEALDGLIYPSAITMSNPNSAKIAGILKKELGDKFTDLTTYYAVAWDGPYILKKAIETAGSTDSAAVKKAMESIKDFPLSWGNPGVTLSYTPQDHSGSVPLCGFVMRTMKGNRPGDPWSVYQPKCN